MLVEEMDDSEVTWKSGDALKPVVGSLDFWRRRRFRESV